jgi:integrase
MAVQHLEMFMGTNKVMFSQLTSVNVNKWIQTLATTKRAKEMYPVCVRQIFKAAQLELNDYDCGLIRIKTNPWPKVKIPKADRGAKRAVSPDECRAFFSAPCPDTGMVYPLPEFGQDVSKMVLCLAGINTVDLYNMKKTDYRDGIICYQRAKTSRSRSDGAYFEMRVEQLIQPLFEKYKAADDDPYLFNFHKRYCDSDSFSANVNNGIKRICKSLGIPQEKWYCVYTWRHTWATIAQNDCDASIEDVGFAMNHSQRSTKITRGYLKIDFSPAWELNAKVINFIFFSNEKGKLGKARDVDEPQDKLFRLSYKMMVYARAYFRGEVLAEISDIGFNTVEEVIHALAAKLPDFIPDRATVQFRIKNVDTDREAIYERTKGKGF